MSKFRIFAMLLGGVLTGCSQFPQVSSVLTNAEGGGEVSQEALMLNRYNAELSERAGNKVVASNVSDAKQMLLDMDRMANERYMSIAPYDTKDVLVERACESEGLMYPAVPVRITVSRGDSRIANLKSRNIKYDGVQCNYRVTYSLTGVTSITLLD